MERTTMPAKVAAEYVGVSYWKLLEMAKAGGVPHIRGLGRVLFRRESLDRWLEQQEMASLRKPEPEHVGKIRRLK